MQMRKIEPKDVVTHHKVSTPSQPVKHNKRLTNRAPVLGRCDIVTVQACDTPASLVDAAGLERPSHAPTRVGTHTRQTMDMPIQGRDFKVDRQAARQH